MSAKIKTFVDTNVLVYCFDSSDPEKKERANILIEHLWNASEGVLSLQVLKEFFVTVTSKLRRKIDLQTAKSTVMALSDWDIFLEDIRSLEKAFEIVEKHRLSFWDANILSAAILSGCQQIYSEDLNHRQNIEGVRIINPFL